MIKKEDRYDKIIDEINGLIDKLVIDIKNSILLFDHKQVIQNSIKEYYDIHNINQNSNKSQKLINTLDLSEFIFNKEKQNQINIINDINGIVDKFRYSFSDKIVGFAKLKFSIDEIIPKKPSFFYGLFNKQLKDDYNLKLKYINDTELKINKIKNIREKIEEGIFIKKFIKIKELPEKLANIKLNRGDLLNIQQDLKNIDVFSKLNKDNILDKDLQTILSSDLLKSFENETIKEYNVLIDELKQIKSKNIISKSEQLENIQKECDTFLDKGILLVLKPIISFKDKYKEKIKDLVSLDKTFAAVVLSTIAVEGCNLQNNLLKDQPNMQALAKTVSSIISNPNIVRDEGLVSFFDYLQKTKQENLIDKIDKKLNHLEAMIEPTKNTIKSIKLTKNQNNDREI